MPNIVIIGAGASGMAAAIAASAESENRVTLFERQARVGRKLLATGNGRCNLTNTAASPENYHGADRDFVRCVLEEYPPSKVLEFFRSLGLVTREEHGGRVYPMSDSASSVLDVLRLGLEKANIELLTGTQVLSVKRDGPGFAVTWDGGKLHAHKLIIACGSCAGAKLGGGMSGYELLGSLGHSRTALYPSLTQIRTVPDYPRAMKGVRCDALVSIMRGGELLAEERGDLLFTETGISGTAVFSLSRVAASAGRGLDAVIDFFPDMTAAELEKLLAARRALSPSLPANQVFTGTVHSRVGQMICKAAGVSGGVDVSALDRGRISALAEMAKAFTLPITGVSGFESAQVAAGGISTAEFNPATLESRIVPGLFACGEVLDVDGDCGGYNLQWAWASGLRAGRLGR